MKYGMFMQKSYKYFLVLLLSVAPIKLVTATDITYPYYATPERAKAINSGYHKIKIGLTVNEVVNIIGKPDEIHDLREPIKINGKKIGFTYWYLLQRIQENGSQNDKNERLVRVSFDLNGKVFRVDKW